MARVLLVSLLALGCSAAPASTYERSSSLEPTAGSGGSSSSAGTSTIVDGGTSSVAGTGGTSTSPAAGSGGAPMPMAGSGAGGAQAGQGSGGTGTVALDGCGNGTCDPYDQALGCGYECSCGNGTCETTDYDFRAIGPGGSYLPDLPACRADCPLSCGNGKCDPLHDQWQGCSEECVVTPPEPIVICPFPAYVWPHGPTWDSPYHPGTHLPWMPGDRVTHGAKCYRCESDATGCGSDPSIDYWAEIPCDC